MTSTAKPLTSRSAVARLRPGDVVLDLVADDTASVVELKRIGFAYLQGPGGVRYWRHVSDLQVVHPVEWQR